MGRNGELSRQNSPFRPVFINSVFVGGHICLDEHRKAVGYSRYDAPFGSVGSAMMPATVEKG